MAVLYNAGIQSLVSQHKGPYPSSCHGNVCRHCVSQSQPSCGQTLHVVDMIVYKLSRIRKYTLKSKVATNLTKKLKTLNSEKICVHCTGYWERPAGGNTGRLFLTFGRPV